MCLNCVENEKEKSRFFFWKWFCFVCVVFFGMDHANVKNAPKPKWVSVFVFIKRVIWMRNSLHGHFLRFFLGFGVLLCVWFSQKKNVLNKRFGGGLCLMVKLGFFLLLCFLFCLFVTKSLAQNENETKKNETIVQLYLVVLFVCLCFFSSVCYSSCLWFAVLHVSIYKCNNKNSICKMNADKLL